MAGSSNSPLSGRVLLAWLLAGLAVVPKLATLPGFRLLDAPVSLTFVSVLVTELYPATGVGFLLLLGYLIVSEFAWTDSPDARASQLSLSVFLGLSIAATYVLFSLALWIDLRTVSDGAHGVIVHASRAIYTSPAGSVVDPVAVRTVETDLRRTVRAAEGLLLRSPGRSARWPAYLFVSYLAVSDLTKRLQWLDDASRPLRFALRAVTAVFALIYGLVLAHNFFPGPHSLPWRGPTIVVWLFAHTCISVLVLALLRSATTRDVQPPISATVVVLLLLGVTLAVVDGLYPIPELLLLGFVPAVAVSHWLPVPRVRELSIRAVDVESQLLDGLGAAWRDPERLFGLLVAFQGLWLGSWIVWALLFSAGSPFSESTDTSPVLAAILVVLFSPLLVSAAYWMWFWIGEIRRWPAATNPRGRPPDLLVFPTTTVASFLVADRLFGVHLVVGLLAVGGILLGLAGTWWSIRTCRSARTFPWTDREITVPLAFLVQFGGLALASWFSASPYGTPGSYLVLLVSTLGPLYFYPVVRRNGLGPISPLPSSIGLVVAVTGVSGLYVARFDPVSIINSAVLGIAAVALAWSMTLRDVSDALR